MSINPPSDIVLDVARAADPARSTEAAERLARMAGDSDPASASDGFSTALGSAALGNVPGALSNAASLREQLERNLDRPRIEAHSNVSEAKAYRNFEALVLQNLVESMLPDSDEFFGEGTAGKVWKSMLADQLGADLAKKVDLGIGPKHAAKIHRVGAHNIDVDVPLTSTFGVPLANKS